MKVIKEDIIVYFLDLKYFFARHFQFMTARNDMKRQTQSLVNCKLDLTNNPTVNVVCKIMIT